MTYFKYITFIILLLAVKAEHGPRKLATLFRTEDSYKCKNDCIDEIHYWCPSNDMSTGTCCNSFKGCSNTGSFCSWEASPDSVALPYWSCPHND